MDKIVATPADAIRDLADGASIAVSGFGPWAGIPLKFTVKVTGVRAASAEEIEHRHVHGEHGHHH